MDLHLNDFLNPSNALNICLSRNLITQSRGDHFREYINKLQLFSNSFLFIHDLNTRGGDKNTVFVVAESRVLKSRVNCYKPSQQNVFTM